MDMVIFEDNKPLVLEALRNGEFYYIEAASEVFEADFFRFIKAQTFPDELAETYPMPRKKEEVPFWFYVASNLSMRLHGVHAFDAFPMVVRCGGMLQAFWPKAGRKVVHPETRGTTVLCKGFNQKNHYERETPFDPDYLRKVAKDTDAQVLMVWFNRDVVRVFRRHRAFDPEGIFMGDGSYLFVPDNPNYEGSVKMRFDEHNHPVSLEQYNQMTEAQKGRCRWRRCYKMMTLLHTNRLREFFLFVAVRVVSDNDHECPALCGIAATLTRLSVLTKKSLSSQKEMHPATHLGIVTDGPAQHSKDPLYTKSCPHLPPQTSTVSELQNSGKNLDKNFDLAY